MEEGDGAVLSCGVLLQTFLLGEEDENPMGRKQVLGFGSRWLKVKGTAV